MIDPAPLLVRDPRFRDHRSRDLHPERPERLAAIDDALVPLLDKVQEMEARPATDEEILRAHGAEHLAALRALEGREAQLDPDTYACPSSYSVARLAAGSLVELAQRVARGDARSAFAAIRPPGHHAERDSAMGFCLLNNVAIAARALQAGGMERIAIVDWDVHHGNGTQHSFELERDVLFVSVHQFPWYPGTGALNERGRDAGIGSTINLPLAAGAGDAAYGAVFERVIAPILREFAPECILVSAGYDAHVDDPLASMQLSTQAYAKLAACLCEVANDVCGGRIVLTLEGGYDLRALGDSVRATLTALCGAPRESFDAPSAQWDALVNELREAHAQSWPSLLKRPT